MDQRHDALAQMQIHLVKLISTGRLTKGQRIAVHSSGTVCGPRAGAVEVECGLQSSQLLSALDEATVRQLVPWKFSGTPVAYIPPGSRAVRVEAGWPTDMADSDIHLFSLGTHPRGGGQYIVGKNEEGRTVVCGFDHDKPTALMGGEPGSGKTLALRSIAAQVSGAAWGVSTATRLVLIDGKFGEGLGAVSRLPGVAGPLAVSLPDATKALAWTHAQMAERYDEDFPNWDLGKQERAGRIICIVDEVQSFSSDATFTELLRKLTSQGRAAWVNVLIATHHPTVAVLNDSVLKHTSVGRIGLRVTSYKASEAVFGGPTPRADYLQGKGDSYVATPSAVQRVQWAYLTQPELARMSGAEPELSDWPDWDGNLNQDRRFTGAEIGAAMAHAEAGGGRDTLKRFLAEQGLAAPGSGRAGELLKVGKEAVAKLKELGYNLCQE